MLESNALVFGLVTALVILLLLSGGRSQEIPQPVVIIQQPEQRSRFGGHIIAIIVGAVVALSVINKYSMRPTPPTTNEGTNIDSLSIVPPPVVPPPLIIEEPPKTPQFIYDSNEIRNKPVQVMASKGEDPKPQPKWAVWLRDYEYSLKPDAIKLKKMFPRSGIIVLNMVKKERYRCCIMVATEEDGNQESKRWKGRKKDWAKFDLNPKTINLSKSCYRIVQELGSEECICEGKEPQHP